MKYFTHLGVDSKEVFTDVINLSFVKIIPASWWRIGLRGCLSHFFFCCDKTP